MIIVKSHLCHCLCVFHIFYTSYSRVMFLMVSLCQVAFHQQVSCFGCFIQALDYKKILKVKKTQGYAYGPFTNCGHSVCTMLTQPGTSVREKMYSQIFFSYDNRSIIINFFKDSSDSNLYS